MLPDHLQPGTQARLRDNIGDYHRGQLVIIDGGGGKGLFHYYVPCRLNGKRLWFRVEELDVDGLPLYRTGGSHPRT